jgi:uncharacterized membrane protein YgcG
MFSLVSMKRSVIFVFFLVCCVVRLPFAYADEVVTRFDVTALFDSKGVMEVTEKIRVIAEGKNIRRGIIRHIPIRWDRQDGKSLTVALHVKEVLRNGAPEEFAVSRAGRNIEIATGSEKRLPQGEHEFTLKYTVANHFSRFADWDELYWNVTGNEWFFTINQASFRLFFRNEAGNSIPLTFQSIDVYTGRTGEKGKAAVIRPDSSVITTAPLSPGQGLTVAYTWPRDVLKNAPDPVQMHPLEYAFVPTAQTVFYWIVPLLVWVYLYAAYRKLRPRSAMPTVIPLFEPPYCTRQGDGQDAPGSVSPDAGPAGPMSPGYVRCALWGTYDGVCFAADLMHIACKGGLKLEQDAAGKPVLCKVEEGEEHTGRNSLSVQERGAVNALFTSSGRIEPGLTHNPHMHDAMRHLGQDTEEKCKGFFTKRIWPISIGVAGFFLLPVLFGLFVDAEDALFLGFMMIFGLITCGLLASVVVTMRRGAAGLGMIIPQIFMASVFGISVCIFAAMIVPELGLPPGFIGAVVTELLAVLVFYMFSARSTDAGLLVQAKIQGLKMYLGTAEEKRFEALYPPKDSIDRFEKLLPYALALGVGKTWANRFERYMQTTGEQPKAFRHTHSWKSISSFSARSSYSSAKRSSSGSGSSGGGSSGRGSGGGGGRGR